MVNTLPVLYHLHVCMRPPLGRFPAARRRAPGCLPRLGASLSFLHSHHYDVLYGVLGVRSPFSALATGRSSLPAPPATRLYEHGHISLRRYPPPARKALRQSSTDSDIRYALRSFSFGSALRCPTFDLLPFSPLPLCSSFFSSLLRFEAVARDGPVERVPFLCALLRKKKGKKKLLSRGRDGPAISPRRSSS